MDDFFLSEIHVYPIKSLGGISLQQAQFGERGLQYDRTWMLIDSKGMFISQRKYPELALLNVSINNDQLTVTHKKELDQHISFDVNACTGIKILVSIWDDHSHGMEVSTMANAFFSDYLNMDVRLVKMPVTEKRYVDPRYAHNSETVGFADGYPFMIISEASLNGLNSMLDDAILMDRFRPNFVFSGGEPHIEDQFLNFFLGEHLFSAVKPCARCVMTTINQQTGSKGQEPLKTLANYRSTGRKVLFGQNLIHMGNGTVNAEDRIVNAQYGIVSVGDSIRVKDWQPVGEILPPFLPE